VQDGQEWLDSHVSRQLHTAKKKLTVIVKELSALVFDVKQFRSYLYGQKFKLVTKA
jgi:hypothetical protein